MSAPPPLLKMIEALIAAPSVSSINPGWDQSNQTVIEHLHSWLSDLGMHVEILQVPGRPGKVNLLAGAGQGADGLLLSGHSDTVPCDEGRWHSDPFRLRERDGRLYGLGSCDMKSFFALVIEALRPLDLQQLKRPLTVLATADEESSMSGAQAMVDAGRKLGRYAVIGEPTGLQPVRMHKGISMETIRLIGRSGHSSNPALGVSALEGMHRVIGEILAWRSELQAAHRNRMFEVEVPTLNLGHIHGGDNPNRICGDCELQIDLRPLPGMSLQSLREALSTRLRRLLLDSGLALELSSPFAGIPAMETPADSRIVRAAEQLTGQAAQAVAFGTEAPFFQQLGMQSLVLGPGNIQQAHQPDEFLELSQLKPAISLIRSLVRRFCFEPAVSAP